MSIYSNQLQVAARMERHESIDMSVVEFDNEPVATESKVVTSFMVEQNDYNDWIYFTDQSGERMPLPDGDETVFKAGGFAFSGKRMGYYHKNDGTYSLEMLNKTAAYFAPASAPAVTGERPITFSANDYEVILAIESAMLEQIELVLGYEMVTPDYLMLPAKTGFHLYSAKTEKRGHHRAWIMDYNNGVIPTHRISGKVIELGDGSNSAAQKVQKPTKDSMGMDVMPEFGKVAKVNPTAPEPPSELVLAIQDPRSETAKEESRMKAAESMTIPMFAEHGEESPDHKHESGHPHCEETAHDGRQCNCMPWAVCKECGRHLCSKHSKIGPDGRDLCQDCKDSLNRKEDIPAEHVPAAIERAFFEAETLEEALDTGYLEHVYDSIDMAGVVDPKPPQRDRSRKQSTISPNHPEFLKFFEPAERGEPVLGAILRGDCSRCHSHPALDNPMKWCEKCDAPKGNGEGKVGDYVTRYEIADTMKRVNLRKRHHCGICGEEVPESRIEPAAKPREKQKAALCEACERAALDGFCVSPDNGSVAE